MRASNKTYREVAKACSAYEPISTDKITNSSCEGDCSCSGKEISCITCKHFSQDEHCRLDLYDKIIANHNIEA